MSKRKGAIVVLCALMMSPVFLIIDPCTADMAYFVYVMPDGGGLHNGSQISMPHADVGINITNTLDCVIVNQSATFEIFTNRTQNVTLAFVYYPGLLFQLFLLKTVPPGLRSHYYP